MAHRLENDDANGVPMGVTDGVCGGGSDTLIASGLELGVRSSPGVDALDKTPEPAGLKFASADSVLKMAVSMNLAHRFRVYSTQDRDLKACDCSDHPLVCWMV